MLNKLYISKLWNILYSIKNTIDIPIKYSYALTVYKSQGSTFRKIFVDMNDMKICVKDKSVLSKSLYTAITRGAEKIFCYKKSTSDYYSEDLKKYPVVSGQGPNEDESVSKDALDLKLLNPNPEGASALRMADPAAAA